MVVTWKSGDDDLRVLGVLIGILEIDHGFDKCFTVELDVLLDGGHLEVGGWHILHSNLSGDEISQSSFTRSRNSRNYNNICFGSVDQFGDQIFCLAIGSVRLLLGISVMLGVARERKEFLTFGSVELRQRIVIHVLKVKVLVELEVEEVGTVNLVILLVDEEVLHHQRIVNQWALLINSLDSTFAVKIFFWINHKYLFETLKLVFVKFLANFEVHFVLSDHVGWEQICCLYSNI